MVGVVEVHEWCRKRYRYNLGLIDIGAGPGRRIQGEYRNRDGRRVGEQS